MDDKTIPISKVAPGQKTANRNKKKVNTGSINYQRALFDQTGECVFIIGLDLRYQAANRQALSLLGYEEHEFIGMSVGEVMSLDEGLTHGSILGEGPAIYERVLKRKDGSTLPVEVSTAIVNNENDEPAYIQSIARDISSRKHVEEELKRQTQILSVISDATANLLQSSNIEARIPEVLESLGRTMGVSSCCIFEVTTSSDQPVIKVQYKWTKKDFAEFDPDTVIAEHIPSILDSSSGHIHSSKSNNQISFSLVTIRSARGQSSCLGLFDEHSDRIWSEAELDVIRTSANLIGSALQRNDYEETIRLSERRNRIMLSALPDLLIRVDRDGMILDYSVNPNHPLYVHRDVIAGRKLADTWPADVAEKILGEDHETGFTVHHLVEGFKLPYSDDEYESRLYPISANEALIVIRDVTEQSMLNQMKSDFINRASHELRTPVTTAILLCELIQEGGEPDELDEYWRSLRSELRRQKILIDRLLLAGRLESGMMKLEHATIDLISILLEAVQAVKPIASKKKVSINLYAPTEPVYVIGDKSALEQVFINLINNATKFSPEGKSININLTEADEEVVISLIDQGYGIPPEAISHLFERFYRAKNVTVAEIPGSGIGLYIVKSIVDELGGSIKVESELNKGTMFVVTLKKSE
ncbi:MAG: PAS domain S-box protein [Anaerolineales bacterium]|nr:PAS domain S-box protein [Anaerolineales bacterium]